MIITTPVTDYIPASILTAQGDIVIRDAADPIGLARPADVAFLRNFSSGAHPSWGSLVGTVNHYFKCKGAGTFPAFEMLALRDTGVKVASYTRNAGGDQIISGWGFQTSGVIFTAIDDISTNQNWSIGFDDGTTAMVIFNANNNVDILKDLTRSLYIQRAVGNRLLGNISAIGADGITISWALTGACNISYILFAFP